MSFSPLNYTLSVVSVYPLSGKSALCKRLIDSNIDNYQKFLSEIPKITSWFYWGSIKHRRLDEKREAIFHLIEHTSISTSENESVENYLKRISNLTIRIEEKRSSYLKTYPKDKITIDGFLCIFDLYSNRIATADFVNLLNYLLKTRRPIIIVTTKNDLIDNQITSAQQFEQSIHNSFSTIPIIHTSAHEHVNIQSVLELSLYGCDETTRKHFYTKYISPNYADAYKNEQSLKHVIQTEYRALLNRHVPDYRIVTWEKFYDRWQHHTCVQTFIDMFGKLQAKNVYDEHVEELRKTSRQKLIDERLIPIIEMLVTDQKIRFSRNWDFVRLQMQKHPCYNTTVIPASMWSEYERNNTNNNLLIPDDLLDTIEARFRHEVYINNRQNEQTRRTNCRLFFDLLNRFSDAGLVHYGDSYDKDCVYFLGRECYESLDGQDRLRIFALHQSYLYRLICLQFVELLFESLEIFIQTFEKMNLATKTNFDNNTDNRQLPTVTIDEIFQREIIQQIKHDTRYKALNKRETDRHRLIMCHCHFLYDCIYYPSININRLLKQRRRSFRRRKSSLISLNSYMSIDENFCPYTRKILSNNIDDNEERAMKKFEIGCPMENTCADVRIVNEILSKLKLKAFYKTILLCGNENDINHCYRILSTDSSELKINFLKLNYFKSQTIDGILFLSSNAQEILDNFISTKRIHLNIDHIPILNLYSQLNHNSIMNIPNDQIRSTFEQILSNGEPSMKLQKSINLRILLCFMCGGDKNDVELFFNQISSRFSVTVANQSSFVINVFLDRLNRKVELIPVSFHSLFAIKLNDFHGFILFYDQNRNAAAHTMTYLEKHIITTLENDRKEYPPIYVLSCIKDPLLSNIRRSLNNTTRTNSSVQCHSGTIRNFCESHLLHFINQCWIEKYGNLMMKHHDSTGELLIGVTSCLDNDRMSSLSTPTNNEKIFNYQSSSTMIPTTPIDPSVSNLSIVSSLSISTNSMSDSQSQPFQKSTGTRFTKLIEHPTNKKQYPSSILNGNMSENNELKYDLNRKRSTAQVIVPLATPEIVELNEIVPATAITQKYTESIEQIENDKDNFDLERKSSDRKTKRIRAKQQNDLAKKPAFDDDKNGDKKKRRPSFKRRKKNFDDQTQIDSGIDSRMDSKDSNKISNTPEPSTSIILTNEDDSSVGDVTKDSKNASAEELGERPTANWILRQLQSFAQARREKNDYKTRSSIVAALTSATNIQVIKTTSTQLSPYSSTGTTYHQLPIRLTLNRCLLSNETGIPLFIEKCTQFIEEHGLSVEGLYRISGYKNQVEFIIHKLIENPNIDLNLLQIPASAVATAFKDMMRKLDEPILSLEQFNECQTLTIDQLREQNFFPIQKALLRTTDLKYRTNRHIFKHLHFVSQHAGLTHMDSSNLAVLWWPNLFQPQFHDLRTAEQICQKAKPLIQAIIDNYSIIFILDSIKEDT